MKKTAYIIMMVLLIGLTACSGDSAGELPKAEAVLTAKVIKFYESSMLVAGENAYDLFMVPIETQIFDSKGVLTDRAALLEGQEIQLGYSGAIMESYPAQCLFLHGLHRKKIE